MSALLFGTVLATLTSAAAPNEAPMVLITDHGVELQANERVFLLFAALNAAGYSEEPKHEGPPLNAPVFHPIREDVRDALRGKEAREALGPVREVFETQPLPIRTYIEAVLALGAEGVKPGKEAATLAGALAPLERFREGARVAAVFDEVAAAQRDHMKALKAKLETDFEAARAVMGDEGFRAPVDLVVVPNPLDGHGLVREATLGGKTYLVVGPGLEAGRAAILEEALRPTIGAAVEAAWRNRGRLADDFERRKSSRRISERWSSGAAYLTDALVGAVAHRAITRTDGSVGRDADEQFIDEQAKEGMYWTRNAFRMLGDRGDASLVAAVPKLVRDYAR